MTGGTFCVGEVETTDEPPFCVLVGEVRGGTVAPGMMLCIPLNRSMQMTIRIKTIGYRHGTQRLALSLECESGEEAQLVAALNIAGEELVCQD